MSKKMMLLALAAVSAAMFAMPAAASATPWHLTHGLGGFTVHGGAGKLTNTTNSQISCTTTTGSGSFTSSTAGTITLEFHGCKSGETNCGTAGTIKVGPLPFHTAMIATGKPGILITPGTTAAPTFKQFAHFFCSILTVEVFGNGILGTITAPECGKTSKTATLSFKPKAGITEQEHISYTGVNYDLMSRTSLTPNHHATAALESHTTLTFNNNVERAIQCT